jgi:hypothetical protein
MDMRDLALFGAVALFVACGDAAEKAKRSQQEGENLTG